jgi:farnesyl diphosphate synthase
MIPPVVQVLALPVGLIAIASYRVADKLDGAVHTFFAMTVEEQLSLLGIVFGVVFAAVAVSHAQIGSSVGGIASGRSRTEYPLLEISQASTDLDKFNCLYPVLREEILQQMQSNEMPPAALAWCKEMMDYNVPGGKLNRGTTVVAVLRALVQKRGGELSPLQVARASVLGWSIEFLQAFFLVADDVMDDSQTRRGQPCWYKNPTVKLIAINDSFLLESFVFSILKLHFGGEKYFGTLVQLLLDVIQKTEFGQLLDLTTASGGSEGTSSPSSSSGDLLDRFTMDQYRLIVKYKTAYYSFYLPVALGMVLGGVTDPESFETTKRICCAMGEYFQVQDDYLDCFGDPSVIGKVGTDIQDNKCSWLVVTALSKCDAKQRRFLRDNYGQWNDSKVQRVKQLYRELDLPSAFEKYEEDSYGQIQDELDRLKKVPRAVFDVLLKKIYKRSM